MSEGKVKLAFALAIGLALFFGSKLINIISIHELHLGALDWRLSTAIMSTLIGLALLWLYHNHTGMDDFGNINR